MPLTTGYAISRTPRPRRFGRRGQRADRDAVDAVDRTGLPAACPHRVLGGLRRRGAITTYQGVYIPGVGTITFPVQTPTWAVAGTWDADARAVGYESQREEDPLPSPAAVAGTRLRRDPQTTDNSAGRIRIRALGNAGTMSEWSDWADYECLPVPTGLAVDCAAGATVTVSWDNDPNATAYEAKEDGGDLAAYSGAANTFTRTGTMGDTYRWRVRAETGGIFTQWTDWAEATCGQPPANLQVACTAGGAYPAVLSASWDPVSWATGYEAEENGGNLPAYAGSAVSLTRITAAANTEYRWRVRATGPGGTVSPWSGWVGDTCPPAAPGGAAWA